MKSLVLAFMTVVLAGCNLQSLAYNPPAPPPAPVASMTSVKVMIFGGTGHKTYLGCVNCSEYDSDSIFNRFGTHGSPYSSESISNHFTEYGSAYSSESACSRYASDPPVVVDGNGRFYGKLTINDFAPGRITNERLLAWLAASCN